MTPTSPLNVVIMITYMLVDTGMAAKPLSLKAIVDTTREDQATKKSTDPSNSSAEVNEAPAETLQQKQLPGAKFLAKHLHGTEDRSAIFSADAKDFTKDFVKMTEMGGLASWTIWAVLVFLVYLFCYNPEYEKGLLTAVDSADPVEVFYKEHFNCWHNAHDCLCACFCVPLRWADTMDIAGILTFNTAFEVFMTLSFFERYYRLLRGQWHIHTGSNGLWTPGDSASAGYSVRRLYDLHH